jgi:hypothetical protein
VIFDPYVVLIILTHNINDLCNKERLLKLTSKFFSRCIEVVAIIASSSSESLTSSSASLSSGSLSSSQDLSI